MKNFFAAVATVSLLSASAANADWAFNGEQAISETENGIQLVLLCDVDGHPTFQIEGHRPERPGRETFNIAIGDLGASPFYTECTANQCILNDYQIAVRKALLEQTIGYSIQGYQSDGPARISVALRTRHLADFNLNGAAEAIQELYQSGCGFPAR